MRVIFLLLQPCHEIFQIFVRIKLGDEIINKEKITSKGISDNMN